MTVSETRPRVLVAGGGIAALEPLLALRVHAGAHLSITLLSADAVLAPPAMTVAEPFERGGGQAHDWREISTDLDARLVLDRLVAVDTDAATVFTDGGRRIPYDLLVVATGARRVEPLAGALTFGMRPSPTARLRAVVADVLTGTASSIAFALPWPSSWSLPLYELALMTAHELRQHGSPAAVRIVTPELRALQLLGPAAHAALQPLFHTLGVELVCAVQPRAVVAGGLQLHDGDVVEADHVVTVADIVARPLPGLPSDRAGFVPVDAYGRVVGEPVRLRRGRGDRVSPPPGRRRGAAGRRRGRG